MYVEEVSDDLSRKSAKERSFLGQVIWHHRFKGATDGDAKGDVGALVARGVAGFAGIEVALASFSLHDFARSGDSNALGHRFVGLHCHTGVSKMCEG